MTTQIVATRLNGDDQLAMVETVSLTLMALLALLLFRATPRGGAGGGAQGRGARPGSPVRQPLARLARGGAGWGLAALLLLPHLTLLLVSFVPVGTWTTEPLPPAYTWTNYADPGAGPGAARPLLNSLWLATVATVAAVAIALAGRCCAFAGGYRAGGPSRRCWRCPGRCPGTVFAIALATAFSVRAPLAGRFVLVGTLWILPLAYLVRNLPITSRAIFAGFRALDPSLDEAAATPRARGAGGRCGG